jgi:DNA-binding NarL/FixJ family response regulator
VLRPCGAGSEVTQAWRLKGLSHKEIAEVRRTSERTVRQQAREVYGKAQLAGRAELSAFFLEDLFLPAEQRDTPDASVRAR